MSGPRVVIRTAVSALLLMTVFSTPAMAEPETMTQESALAQESALMQDSLSLDSLGTLEYSGDAEELADLEQMQIGYQKAEEVSVSYDTEVNMYRYEFPNHYVFQMNIPNGAVSTEPVRMQVDRDRTSVLILKDGELFESNESFYFSQPGNYILQMNCSPGDYDGTDLMIYSYEVDFQILKNKTSRNTCINAPDGYELASLRYNGKPAFLEGRYSMFLEKDGDYEVCFQAEGLPDYRISFRKDTVAPIVKFSEPVRAKKCSFPLSFEAGEEGVEVSVYQNGAQEKLLDQTIRKGGWYLVRVSDPVGNSRDYRFFIRSEYHVFSRELVILLVLVLFGIVIAVRTGGWNRKF